MTQILPARLEKYGDFVNINSTDGVYSPEKGLEALLSVLTPDPKPVVLWAMGPNEYYFGAHQLFKAVLARLNALDLTGRNFPVKETSTWQYCQYRDHDGEAMDGSLVNIGAVVKHAHMETQAGLVTGYQSSAAGLELAVPLLFHAAEFVRAASASNIPHKYDSMWRIFSSVNSRTANRKQLVVYQVVKFLVDNRKEFTCGEIAEAFGEWDPLRIRNALASLGNAGIINYEHPSREEGGRRRKGFVDYSLFKRITISDDDVIYNEMQTRRSRCGSKATILGVIGYIRNHPDSTYNAYILADKLNLKQKEDMRVLAVILTVLKEIEILERNSGFSSKFRSRASANDLTIMLYDKLLVPAHETAESLAPSIANPDPEKLRLFLANYQAERSNYGPPGGEIVKAMLRCIVPSSGDGMKLSQIVEEGNRILGRSLTTSTYAHQLQSIGAIGKKGHYRLPRN